MIRILQPKARRWLYGIAAAALPLAAGYGLITESAIPLWLNLGAAVLFIVADRNTPADPPAERPPETV